MGLETRRNGNRYYYRKRRRNGRIVSEYVGSGPIAALYAAMDGEKRAAAGADRARQAAERRRLADEERAAAALERQAQQIAALALLACGYHQHKRQWRKRRQAMIEGSFRRMSGQLKAAAQAEQARRAAQADTPLPAEQVDQAAGGEDIRALMKRCNRPDASAEDVAALRARIATRPDVLDIVAPFDELLRRELGATKNVLTRELRLAQAEQQRAALGYDTAPALERPLIDHVLLCQERLAQAERIYTGLSATSGTLITHMEYGERRLDRAQARYLRAVETLARVRRVRVELARITGPDGTHAETIAAEVPGR